jgi:hypothetical protein
MAPQTGAVDRAALSRSLAGPYDASNVSAIVSAVAANPAARDIAWAFLRDNWSGVTRYLGYRSTLATLVRTVARNFVSAPLAADVAAFFSPSLVAATPVVSGTFERALENVEAARLWAAEDSEATCAFLRSAAAAQLASRTGMRLRTPWREDASSEEVEV